MTRRDSTWFWANEEDETGRTDALAYIQGEGTISRTIDFPYAGKYMMLRLRYANRANSNWDETPRVSGQKLKVTFDNAVIAQPTIENAAMRELEVSVEVKAGAHVLSLANEVPGTGDFATLIDDLTVEFVRPNGLVIFLY